MERRFPLYGWNQEAEYHPVYADGSWKLNCDLRMQGEPTDIMGFEIQDSEGGALAVITLDDEAKPPALIVSLAKQYEPGE